ncbi:hypothetical protein OCU04_011756 [Sclerotinia nivalis]|uniref:Uncharacterized protein n=1 Tax=Sclerotinia nivalis TaxID=352851 RepID=A0A9X0A9Z0_9HELO|nr:hypothetical protein OCU04_011756 [Sclerotinia nivalis]
MSSLQEERSAGPKAHHYEPVQNDRHVNPNIDDIQSIQRTKRSTILDSSTFGDDDTHTVVLEDSPYPEVSEQQLKIMMRMSPQTQFVLGLPERYSLLLEHQ